MATDQYGRYYWCILVDESLSEDGEIYANAERVETTTTGDLVLIGKRLLDPEGVNLLIPAGLWRAVYAASTLDGSAVAIDYWLGQVDRVEGGDE